MLERAGGEIKGFPGSESPNYCGLSKTDLEFYYSLFSRVFCFHLKTLFSLSLPLDHSRTHTQTHSHTHSLTHTLTHTQSPQTHSHTHSLTHTEPTDTYVHICAHLCLCTGSIKHTA